MKKLVFFLLLAFALAGHSQSINLDSSFANNGIYVNSSCPGASIFLKQDQNSVWVLSSQKLFKLKNSGVPDSTFGNAGFLDFNSHNGTLLQNIFVDQQGSIYTPSRFFTQNPAFKTQKLLPDGKPDSSFGVHSTGGARLGNSDIPLFILQDPSGDLIIAGNSGFYSSGPGGTSVGQSYCTLMKLRAAGIIDSSFGTKGVVTLYRNPSMGRDSHIKSAFMRKDGRIIVALWENLSSAQTNIHNFRIVCLLPNGSIDSTFGTNGEILIGANERQLYYYTYLDKYDNVFVSTTLKTGVKIWKYTAQGLADASFNSKPVIAMQKIYSNNLKDSISLRSGSPFFSPLCTDASDNIYIAYSGNTDTLGTGSPYLYLICQLDKYGTLNQSFGNKGYSDTYYTDNGVYFIDMQGDKLLVAGAVSGIGFSSLASITRFSISAMPSGLSDQSTQKTTLQVYPNPLAENATIRFELREMQSIHKRLIDLYGKVVKDYGTTVYTKGLHTATINTSDLVRGNYILQLKGDKEVQNMQLVK